MPQRIVSFVMSGGVGSRLWPLSREDNPKQFHDFSGDGSMLARTLRRLAARPDGETPIFLIAAERHAERVHADLAGVDLKGGGPLFEPTGRNTAAAVALASLRTLSEYGDELVLVVPSDHEISTTAQFWQSIEAGAVAANAGRLVVFGLKPTQPETGYGYIEVGADRAGVFDVSRFVEKPDLATAQAYLDAGNFYWNTGIFLFRAGAMRDALAAYEPKIWQATEAAYKAATSDLSGLYMALELYSAIPSTSIDYAIMERAK
ncbi:mannose-1-phosphate guanylyltransferase, partial [Mesorhizobium sp. M2A.F.Ca.ET.046.02.1.1]